MEITHQFLVLFKVFIAAILSGIVGFEREWQNKPAGLRTNMIVGSATCLLISVGSLLIMDYSEEIRIRAALRTDPLRLIEAIVVGVSFIGAGTILKSEKDEKIKYLTTSAALLFAAGVGISVGLELYILAVGVSILGLLINQAFKVADKIVKKKKDT
jgi:putative Mg2+ transporter-C (MgtC) family protein